MAQRGIKRNKDPIEQCYYEVPVKDKLTALTRFLKNHSSEKILVYFPTCNSVMFHVAVLRKVGVPCSEIHGQLSLEENLLAFSDFKSKEAGLLIISEAMSLGQLMPEVVSFPLVRIRIVHRIIILRCNNIYFFFLF